MAGGTAKIEEGNESEFNSDDDDDQTEIENNKTDRNAFQFSRISLEAIVDVRVSNTRLVDEELLRKGYTQILPDVKTAGYSIAADAGTFGRGQSMWVWKYKQGTMSGRLKPVTDVQLNALAISTPMVLAGYTCLATQVSGQWVWIRRAETEAEEADAIVDVVVTIGLQKYATDKIWNNPGVGWNRVDGNFGKGMLSSYDAFLWFRPARARTADANLVSPLSSTLSLKDDMRLSVLLGRVKTSLRHAVPLDRMAATVETTPLKPEETNKSATSAGSSVGGALFDYSYLYHKFDSSSSGQLSVSKFEALLTEAGLRLERRDVHALFHAFNIVQDGYLGRQEFWTLLTLTDYEVDVLLEKVRVCLLRIAGRDDTVPVKVKAVPPATKLHVNSVLREVFRLVNANRDGILSIHDVLALCVRVNVYVTQDEARRLMKLIDRDADDRIEEADFLNCIGRSGDWVFAKAQRLRDAAAALRVWLTRNNKGAMFASANSAQYAAVMQQQWGDLKSMHEKAHGTWFAGFLTADDLLLLFLTMGVRLTPAEAREVALIAGPERNGRLQQPDLIAFMGSSCRSFGELCALLERDILKPLIDCYRSYRGVLLAGEDARDFCDEYETMVRTICRAVDSARGGDAKAAMDVVSVPQLKAGVEAVMRGYSTPEDLMPNLEEWVCLCCATGATVAENDTFGVKARVFVTGLCVLVVGPLESARRGEEASLPQVSAELQKMIRHEAELAGARSRKRDYKAVFRVFDTDAGGSISLSEFRAMLQKLQLIDNLTDPQVSALLAMFDRKKKGAIDLEDFTHFAEKSLTEGGGDGAGAGGDEQDSDEEDRQIGLLSSNAPAAITRNADCDWLVWFLWKECCKVSAKEPEAVVTDLEVACAETNLGDAGAGFIEAGELWQLLAELSLRGHMTRAQFDAGVRHLLEKAGDKQAGEHSLVDYEALCRYVVRMGRAFNEQEQARRGVDETKYQELKKAFIAAMIAGSGGKGSATPGDPRNSMRFERVFKRMDSNADGSITLEEFRQGLRRLKYRGAKEWSQQMVWRLFEDIDKNSDGLLSLMELSSFVRSSGQISGAATATSGKKKGKTAHSHQGGGGDSDADEEDERLFFGGSGRGGTDAGGSEVSDEKLFAKVSAVLQDSVPPPIGGGAARGDHAHTEQVKSCVRKFFRRADEHGRGLVPEARFKVFCRQSGLAAKLSAGEMRQLLTKLTRKTSSRSTAEALVDYERLCGRISVVEESAPHAHGEGVLLRLQDAAIASESAGRPFLGLCSLSDHALTGRIAEEDLVHTARMMGCVLLPRDTLALRDLLPHCFTMSPAGHPLYDYKELGRMFEAYTPRVSAAAPQFSDWDLSRSLALPRRAVTPLGGSAATPVTLGRSLPAALSTMQSPGGHYLTTPLAASALGRSDISDLDGSRRPGSTVGGSSNGGYELVLNAIAEKVGRAVAARSRAKGFSFSLQKQIAVYDRAGSGLVSVRLFVSTLEDVGVTLSATDIAAVQSAFGAQDAVDYLAFCGMCDSLASSSQRDEYAPHGQRASRASLASTAVAGDDLAFLRNRRIAQRLLELRRGNSDPRDIFEALDPDRTGLVSAQRFVDVVRDMELLQTENQLNLCVSAFASLSERNMICYEDFCADLERAAGAQSAAREGFSAPPRRRTYATADDDVGRQSRHDDTFGSLGRSYNSERKPPREQYRQFDADDDDDNELLPSLSKSISGSLLRPNNNHNNHNTGSSWNRSADFGPSHSSRVPGSPLRMSSRLEAPRSPPGKVGVAMWGSDTPLGKKGRPPRPNGGKWVCAVCYYTENSESLSECEVCTSPNHNLDKDFQVKVQCSNCTFMNGQFALACEMCGQNIAKKK